MSSRPPSLAEFMAALNTIKAWLMAQLTSLRAKFPAEADHIDSLIAFLNSKTVTLDVLAVVASEVQSLTTGHGPVDHDPVDLA